MNPCPCGFHNHPEKECMCSGGMVQKYLNRISGKLLDRIDIHIEVVPVNYDKLADSGKVEHSTVVRERVVRAREIQAKRFSTVKGVYSNFRGNQLQESRQGGLSWVVGVRLRSPGYENMLHYSTHVE